MKIATFFPFFQIFDSFFQNIHQIQSQKKKTNSIRKKEKREIRSGCFALLINYLWFFLFFFVDIITKKPFSSLDVIITSYLSFRAIIWE